VEGIFWIRGNPPAPLAIVMRPRGGGWLERELERMKRGGVETLVSLLEPDEADLLDLSEEERLAEAAGMEFLSFPIPDTHVPPDPAAFRKFAAGLAERLRSGEGIGVHCRGSIGRATVTAACALIHLGWKARAALEAVESARGCPVPDTREQEEWILGYEARP
jgi:protein-tyrosine phosphatase